MKTITVPDVAYYRKAWEMGKQLEFRRLNCNQAWIEVRDLFDLADHLLLDYEFRIVHDDLPKEPEDPYAVFKQAHKNGKVIQCKSKSLGAGWVDGDHCNGKNAWFTDSFDYRIKPEPKYRKWMTEEVPVGALISSKLARKDELPAVILGVIEDFDGSGPAVIISRSLYGCNRMHYFLSDLITYHGVGPEKDQRICSTDHGLTWLPCGVLVEE